MGRSVRGLSKWDLWRCFVLILVLCGTQKQNFSRMIKEVEKLAGEHDIIVQAGHTDYHSAEMNIFNFLPEEKLSDMYEKAAVIITHGGAGSIFKGLKNQKKMVVFPRLEKYGEHVDDHQLQLAQRLEELGFLKIFNDGDDIHNIFDQTQQMILPTYDLKGDILTLIEQQLIEIFGF